MTELVQPPNDCLFQVAALDGDGKSSIWHIVADSIEKAKEMVTEELSKSTLKAPRVVLAIVPKGKIA